MGRQPDYSVCIGGAEYAKGKRPWTRIGSAWRNEGSGAITIQITFPTNILIDPTTNLKLFPEATEDKF